MNRTVEIVLVVVMIGTACAFGGVQPAAYSLMEIALLAAWLAVTVRDTWHGEVRFPGPLPPVLFGMWIALSLVPLPAGLVHLLEPARFSVPGGTSDTVQKWLALSIYPHATILTGIRYAAMFAAFSLAVRVFDSSRRSSLVVRAAVGLGLFEACYGIVQYLTGWQKIFNFTKQYYTEMATGTYINHNHFAGAIEMTFPFLVGIVFYYFQAVQESRRRRTERDSGSTSIFLVILCSFLVLLMLAGLVFSRSRSGIVSGFFVLIFIALLAQLRVRRKTWLLGLFGFLLVAAGYSLWIGLGPVLARFEGLSQGTNEYNLATRISFSQDTLKMIRDYPWTGVGLGTYAVAFRHYQSGWVNLFADHAHDDYLEFTAETGIAGAALLFLPMVYLLVRMVVAFIKDNRRYRPAVLLGCIGGVLAILLHSATDFNLQIPANSLLLAVILGIGYKAACVERRNELAPRPQAPRSARAVAARN